MTRRTVRADVTRLRLNDDEEEEISRRSAASEDRRSNAAVVAIDGTATWTRTDGAARTDPSRNDDDDDDAFVVRPLRAPFRLTWDARVEASMDVSAIFWTVEYVMDCAYVNDVVPLTKTETFHRRGDDDDDDDASSSFPRTFEARIPEQRRYRDSSSKDVNSHLLNFGLLRLTLRGVVDDSAVDGVVSSAEETRESNATHETNVVLRMYKDEDRDRWMQKIYNPFR